ncbi:GNAT family N-acetyltransferase [Ruania zhangjianzhongii]|uniref:GNAT family N-acetyltransferase n=1 Tax=Ruania zhangjianzhongii TaxID=2603206 RepID=UPI001AEF3C4A|nr:GNAT family N-acetyltransferase [Ruania zhangjianzhongii]
MLPAATARLCFREMTEDDLDAMAALLGDPAVMTYYSAPKTREQALAWITWNQANYAAHGYGLWLMRTRDGEFVGDCGLTWQRVGGTPMLEVGYHVRAALQGRGYATEAAAACRDLAAGSIGVDSLAAIIHPQNVASRRVAEKIGMAHRIDDRSPSGELRTVMGMRLQPSP